MKRTTPLALALATLAALTLSGCDIIETPTSQAQREVENKAADRQAYVPSNDVEFTNYNRAQEVYDSPESIIWCTTTWGSDSSPLITVPVAGKLTSSSVSYLPNTEVWKNPNGNLNIEARSVDGMYHGASPGYRYGFTPGSAYVDFYNMPTFCTTSLTPMQRQNTTVVISGDDYANELQARAEEALSAGDPAAAEEILKALATDGGNQ